MIARKIIRRAIWTVMALATFIALFYAEEDWRGARAWQAVLQQMRDAGEPLTLRELIPPGSPQADLSKTPMFANENSEISRIRLPGVRGNEPMLAALDPLREIDLKAWQHYIRSLPDNHLPPKPGTPAADVLAALSSLDLLFARLENVLAIPGAYFPIDYDMAFGTHLTSSVSDINVARVLQLRGLAHLENGESEEAKDDFLFRFRLEAPMQHRLFLIDLLIKEADQASILPVLWKGMHEHVWTDTDLQQMEGALTKHDFLSDLQSSLRGERLGVFQYVAILSTKAGIFKAQDIDPGERLLKRVFRIWPAGWFELDWARIGRIDARAIAAIHPQKGILDRAAFSAPKAGWWRSHLEIFSSELSPVINSSGRMAAQAETYRRLACVACELERYYLVHHAYPDQLSDLTELPPHLNQEVVSSAPFRYQNLGSTYRLYSMGWDGKGDAADSKWGNWRWPGP